MQSNHMTPQATQLKERRAAHRYRFYVDVEIDWGSKVLWGRVHDISRTGMFIEIAECPWVSASFTAHLALNVPLSVECVVRRVVPGQGIGVTIAISDRKAKRRFSALLRALQDEAKPATAGADIAEPPELLCETEARKNR
jgi:hypothetical protein